MGKLIHPIVGAFIYDIATIQTKGLKSHVNFNYTKYDLMAILESENFMNLKTNTANQKNDNTLGLAKRMYSSLRR